MKEGPNYVQLRNSRLTSSRDSVLGVISVKNKKTNARAFLVFRTVKNSPLSSTGVDIGDRIPGLTEEWVVTEVERTIIPADVVAKMDDRVFIAESGPDNIPFAKQDIEAAFSVWNPGFTTIVAVASEKQPALMSFKESGLLGAFDEELIASVDEAGWAQLKRSRIVGVVTNGSTSNTTPVNNSVVAKSDALRANDTPRESDNAKDRTRGISRFKVTEAALPLGLAASVMLLSSNAPVSKKKDAGLFGRPVSNLGLSEDPQDANAGPDRTEDGMREPLGERGTAGVQVLDIR